MQLLRNYGDSVNERTVEAAIAALRAGQILLYPTDTVYALGCDALNKRAVERLCAFKGLDPAKNKLAVVCADIAMAADYARIDNATFKLIKDNTPGPFTFILPALTRLPKVFMGRKAVGIRIPDNALTRALAAGLGNPILTTTVALDNDEIDITDPEALALFYADTVSVAIDGGSGIAVPSTVIDFTEGNEPVIVRQGAGDIEL